jgi:phage baseplate assembly protein V
MARETLDQLRRLLRPLQVRVANSIARAVVQLVDDSTKLQLVQLGVLAGEVLDDAERFQEYGFTSVPLPGAEAVVIFPNGDRAHPLVVAVDDRRYRPSGGAPGEVTVYNHAGATIRLLANGDIELEPGSGGEVRAGGGAALVTLDEFNDHIHTTTATVGGGATPGTVSAPSPAAAGTSVLKGG